jgi:hypothetical protein
VFRGSQMGIDRKARQKVRRTDPLEANPLEMRLRRSSQPSAVGMSFCISTTNETLYFRFDHNVHPSIHTYLSYNIERWHPPQLKQKRKR